jgi:hypothetical protein
MAYKTANKGKAYLSWMRSAAPTTCPSEPILAL